MSTERFCLYVLGRLHGITRERLGAAVERAGGRLVSKPSSWVTLVGVGHSSALTGFVQGPLLAWPPGLPSSVRAISELNLKRLLGFQPPQREENRHLSAEDISGAARLDPEVIGALALYDVLEPVSEMYGYRDLVAAREVRRLLGRGLGFEQIVRAAVILRRSGRSLCETRLAEAPWGELVQDIGGGCLGDLEGQYALPLPEQFESVDDVFEKAEEAEMRGDLASAERHYGIALRIDPSDPVMAFNLGNVLDSSGRPDEAALAYQRALARDPDFAEAWLNLAVLHEQHDRVQKALECYQSALAARPDYPDALYNLALLLTKQQLFEQALPLWERYLGSKPKTLDATKVVKLMALCRLHVTAAGGSSSPQPVPERERRASG